MIRDLEIIKWVKCVVKQDLTYVFNNEFQSNYFWYTKAKAILKQNKYYVEFLCTLSKNNINLMQNNLRLWYAKSFMKMFSCCWVLLFNNKILCNYRIN